MEELLREQNLNEQSPKDIGSEAVEKVDRVTDQTPKQAAENLLLFEATYLNGERSDVQKAELMKVIEEYTQHPNTYIAKLALLVKNPETGNAVEYAQEHFPGVADRFINN